MEKIIKHFTVTADEEGVRLDTFIARRLEEVSRSYVQGLIREGLVTVEDTLKKPGYYVRCGDHVRIEIPENADLECPTLEPIYVPLDVIYEDDDIVVVNKPPGMVVHPGAGKEKVSLVHALLFRCGSLTSIGSPERPGIVHRLDEDTTGIIVIAKTDRAYWHLVKQFQERQIFKEYIVIVWGIPKQNHGTIQTFLNRHPKDRKKMAVTDKGREAVTHWKIVKTWSGFSLLSVHLVTGRTHQIRVHMAHIHHPVVGDRIYGRHEKMTQRVKDCSLRTHLITVTRQMLHAWKLRIIHPVSGETMQFKAPVPEDMKKLMGILSSS